MHSIGVKDIEVVGMTPLTSRAHNALAKIVDLDVRLCRYWKQPQPVEANTSE